MKSKIISQNENITSLLVEQEAYIHSLAKLCKKISVDPVPYIETERIFTYSERLTWTLKKLNYSREVIKYILDKNDEYSSEYQKDKIAYLLCLDLLDNLTEGLKESEICERAIRVALLILTEGTTMARIEGLESISIVEMYPFTEKTMNEYSLGIIRHDYETNKEKYLSISFHPVIRAAGGTAQGMAILLGEIIRERLGLAKFRYTSLEMDKIFHEIEVYDIENHSLQHFPEESNVIKVLSKIGIFITGGKTSSILLKRGLFLRRMPNKYLRPGMCLVICEGLIYKAKKLQSFLETNYVDVISLKDVKFEEAIKKGFETVRYYMHEIVIGRPVFGPASAPASRRLVLGRARNTGFGTISLNPLLDYALKRYLANGTQLKPEFPSKGFNCTFNSNLDRRFITLDTGSSLRMSSKIEYSKILKIHELGEILVSHGEFYENNYRIRAVLRSKYQYNAVCTEEEKKALFARDLPGLNPNFYINIFALNISEFKYLKDKLHNSELYKKYFIIQGSIYLKEILDKLFLEHIFQDDSLTFSSYEELKKSMTYFLYSIRQKYIPILNYLFNVDILNKKDYPLHYPKDDSLLLSDEILSVLHKRNIIAFNTVRLGFKMGRREKANARERSGGGIAGYGLVKITKLTKVNLKKGEGLLKIFGKHKYFCKVCRDKQLSLESKDPSFEGLITEKTTCLKRCLICRSRTTPMFDDEKTYSEKNSLRPSQWNVSENYEEYPLHVIYTLMKSIFPGPLVLEEFKPSRRDTIYEQELLEKFLIRSQYKLHVFRDGTTRFDATNMPLTSAKLEEINLSVEKAIKFGYLVDVLGNRITSVSQEIYINYQDIVIPHTALSFFFNAANFIDKLLVHIYEREAYYNLKNPEDIIGHLVVSLARHIISGSLARVIGYTHISGVLAHPYFHASKRRNCDGDEDSLMLLLDVYLNNSRKFSDSYRGSLMDTNVLVNILFKRSEVDKEAQNVEFNSILNKEILSAQYFKDQTILKKYKKTFLSGIQNKKEPFAYGVTISTNNIVEGALESTYKVKKLINLKLEEQISLTKKIHGLSLIQIIEGLFATHIIRDLNGNLRRYFRQTFKCKKCSKIYASFVGISCTCKEGINSISMTVRKGGILKSIILGNYLISFLRDKNYFKISFEHFRDISQKIFGETSMTEIISTLDEREPSTYDEE